MNVHVLCQYNDQGRRPPEKRCKGRHLKDNFRKLKLQFKIYMTAAALSAKKEPKYLSCGTGVDGKIQPEGVVQHRR